MLDFHKQTQKFLILGTILFLQFSLQCTQAVPSREILNSNKPHRKDKVTKDTREETNTEVAKIAQIESLITPLINLVVAIPTALKQAIGNLTSGASSGLGSLFSKPGGSGGSSGGLGSLFSGISLNITKGSNSTKSPCSLIDPLLIANIPGVFIAVPIVIIGIAALIAAIAAIVIAIGGLGGEVTKSAYDSKNEGSDSTGYAPSVMSSYGSPASSSYGSPAYSRLSQTVDTATQDFNQAYEKYNEMLSQQQSPSSSYTNTDQSQQYYDGWNNNVVMKRMKHD